MGYEVRIWGLSRLADTTSFSKAREPYAYIRFKGFSDSGFWF